MDNAMRTRVSPALNSPVSLGLRRIASRTGPVLSMIVEITAPRANGTAFRTIPAATRRSRLGANQVNFRRRTAIAITRESPPPPRNVAAIGRSPRPPNKRTNETPIVNPRSTSTIRAVYSRRSKALKNARNVPLYV